MPLTTLSTKVWIASTVLAVQSRWLATTTTSTAAAAAMSSSAAASASTTATAPKRKGALIFLHGLGDSPSGWASLQHQLPRMQPRLADIEYIFPAAPIIPLSINGGGTQLCVSTCICARVWCSVVVGDDAAAFSRLLAALSLHCFHLSVVTVCRF
jgi:Phospholipase/Carboxylesterase